MALITAILSKKIPMAVVAAVLVFTAIYHTGYALICARASAKQTAEIAKLQKSNADFALDNTRLTAQNATLMLDNRAQRKELDALRTLLTEAEKICAKQLTDRELIAAINAGDSCVIDTQMMIISGETSAQAVYFINSAFSPR